MEGKRYVVVNVVLAIALVIGGFAFAAPPALAQDGTTFLPIMAGNGEVPLGEIDITGVDDAVLEVRGAEMTPLGKAEGDFGHVTTHSDLLIPPSMPIAVRLQASGIPVVNEAIAIELQVHAYEAAPNTQVKIELPEGVTLVSGKVKAQFNLAAGQTRSLNAAIAFTQPGEFEIAGSAMSAIDADMVWADDDYLYYTIGFDTSMASTASGDNGLLTALPGPEAPEEAAAAADAEIDEEAAISYAGEMTQEGALAQDLDASGEFPPESDHPDAPALEPAGGDQPIQSSASRKISFCWRMYKRGGGTRPVYDAYYKIYDQDGSWGGSDDDLLGTGYLGYYNGCASKWVSDADYAGTADVYVIVQLTHYGRYRVMTNSGVIWHTNSPTKWNISGNYNFGTLYMNGPDTPTTHNGRSLWIWSDLYWARRTVMLRDGSLGGDPGYVKVKWQPSSTVGTYYSRTNKEVRLKGGDVKSPDTVVHEASHAYMDNVYASSFWPISDCTSPHYIQRVSGRGCAWSEGYTYIITTIVNGDPSYTWPNGTSTLNLETPHCTSSGWDDGPKVEGRIGGVLIDLMDPLVGLSVPQGGSYTGMSNETTGCYEDGVSGMFDVVWDLVYDQEDKLFVTQGGETNSFSNAWESRALPRYIPGRVGDHNTVNTFTHD